MMKKKKANLIEEEEVPRPLPKTKGVNHPKCGQDVLLQEHGNSTTISNALCSMLVNNSTLNVVDTFMEKVRVEPGKWIPITIQPEGKSMAGFFNDPAFSDFSIILHDGTKINVSRIVLAKHSDMFKTMSLHTMEESSTKTITVDTRVALPIIKHFYGADLKIDTIEECIEAVLLLDKWCCDDLLHVLLESIRNRNCSFRCYSAINMCAGIAPETKEAILCDISHALCRMGFNVEMVESDLVHMSPRDMKDFVKSFAIIPKSLEIFEDIDASSLLFFDAWASAKVKTGEYTMEELTEVVSSCVTSMSDEMKNCLRVYTVSLFRQDVMSAITASSMHTVLCLFGIVMHFVVSPFSRLSELKKEYSEIAEMAFTATQGRVFIAKIWTVLSKNETALLSSVCTQVPCLSILVSKKGQDSFQRILNDMCIAAENNSLETEVLIISNHGTNHHGHFYIDGNDLALILKSPKLKVLRLLNVWVSNADPFFCGLKNNTELEALEFSKCIIGTDRIMNDEPVSNLLCSLNVSTLCMTGNLPMFPLVKRTKIKHIIWRHEESGKYTSEYITEVNKHIRSLGESEDFRIRELHIKHNNPSLGVGTISEYIRKGDSREYVHFCFKK